MQIELPSRWRPRPYQLGLWRYLQAGGLRADVAAHRRWGKDEVALNWAAVAAASKVGGYWHLLPEASQGRKAIWDAVNPHTGRRRIDEAFPASLRAATRDGDMMIRFTNGSTWQVCGSDNYNSLVGSPPVGVVFSEWALAKPDCWTYIRPILAENQGWEALMATPLAGVCRWILPWGANDGQLQIAFGTHSALQVWVGGGLYDVTPAGLAAGAIDGTGQAGYGTGPFGEGGYATPTVDDYFPRTWSGGAWGRDLIGSPRLGTIYQWDASDTGAPAAALSNAPGRVTFCLVAPQDQVFALGCDEEVSGAFNALCIRHSSVQDSNAWTTSSTTTSREYILPGGGRIVGGRVAGDHLLVWTNASLFLGTYVGQLQQIWRFTKVGDHCGLIGPGAAVVVGQQAYWISGDRQFWGYGLGGAPQPLGCPIREDFADNLAAAQADKIAASSIGEFGEIRFDYPDSRDGHENSRYLAMAVAGPDAGAWYRGQMARTAMVDAGPAAYPLGVSFEGQAYWHERGRSADGAALPWFIESADQFLSEDRSLLVRTLWPDIQDQVGPVSLTLTSRYRPRGEETAAGPYAIAADDEKVDLRASGRLFRVKFSGSASPSRFRLGAPVFDHTLAGAR